MMTERRRRVVFLLASAGFAAAAPLAAAAWRSPGAVNPAGVPFELAQVPAAGSGSPAAVIKLVGPSSGERPPDVSTGDDTGNDPAGANSCGANG
jgi:hypothetical protein